MAVYRFSALSDGNDLYHVHAPGVTLADSGGVDTVQPYGMDWTLGAGFENLQQGISSTDDFSR